jgi:peptide subunit release factor 1 (eRF1)
MLSEVNLQELLNFQTSHPVLSIYLNTDKTQANSDRYKLQLRGMLKPIALPDDVAAVEEYIEHQYDWSGRSVAIFSCTREGFFRTYPLAVPLQSRARIGHSPHVKPLANMLDFYGGYGVVLIDKQGARVFYFNLGELVEQEGIVGEEVRHTKRGGASSLAGRRGGVAGRTNYVEEVTERNMKEAVDFAIRLFQEYNVRRVVIGGTDDNVAQFRSLLPKRWQSLVMGTFPIGMTASKDEVLERAMAIGKIAEERHEVSLVDAVITNAAKRKGGAIGLDDTLKAVHDGRVQTLVLREGYRAPGYQCTGCGYLTAQAYATCPFCGKMLAQIQDAVELAVRNVMQQGGEVEFLQNPTAADQLNSIGAILRY